MCRHGLLGLGRPDISCDVPVCKLHIQPLAWREPGHGADRASRCIPYESKAAAQDSLVAERAEQLLLSGDGASPMQQSCLETLWKSQRQLGQPLAPVREAPLHGTQRQAAGEAFETCTARSGALTKRLLLAAGDALEPVGCSLDADVQQPELQSRCNSGEPPPMCLGISE